MHICRDAVHGDDLEVGEGSECGAVEWAEKGVKGNTSPKGINIPG